MGSPISAFSKISSFGRVDLQRLFPFNKDGCAVEDYSAIDMADEVSRLAGIAFLCGANIAVSMGAERLAAASLAGSISSMAPEFSKIALLSKNPCRDRRSDAFAKRFLGKKNDVALITDQLAVGYGADLFICPYGQRYPLRIMDLCRKSSSYIMVLEGGFDQLLKRGKIEGLNSIDMLLIPQGKGFIINELMWLSRAEIESGMDLHGEDMLQIRRIGTDRGLECAPEDTKILRMYADMRGESPTALWNAYA